VSSAAATLSDEDLRVIENKLNMLKLDYERYFLGTRPREPVILRQEMQKFFTQWANMPIQNTAMRFRFNSLNSRYQAMKRQWDGILRQMEAGTYKRDLFKAKMRGTGTMTPKQRPAAGVDVAVESARAGEKLFESYREAAMACGQNVKGLSPQKLQSVVDKQTRALKEKLGCKDVQFRVTVKDGKVKLKAAPVKK
jgi:hypothetical protein